MYPIIIPVLFRQAWRPQRSVLSPLLFIIYFNAILNSIHYSNTFTDDTSLFNPAYSHKLLGKRVNTNLKQPCHWLKANRISVNATETDLALFRHKSKSINYDLRILINDKRLSLNPLVKYLGIYLDVHLSWGKQINNICIRLRGTNDALNKLRRFVPSQILLQVCSCLL